MRRDASTSFPRHTQNRNAKRKTGALQEKAFGESNPALAKVLDQLATTLDRMGRKDEAKQFADRGKSLSPKN